MTGKVILAVALQTGCITPSAYVSIVDLHKEPLVTKHVLYDKEFIYVEWHCGKYAGNDLACGDGGCKNQAAIRIDDLFSMDTNRIHKFHFSKAGCLPASITEKSQEVPLLAVTRNFKALASDPRPCFVAKLDGTPQPNLHIRSCDGKAKLATIPAPKIDCMEPGAWWRKPFFYLVSPIFIALDIATLPIQLFVMWNFKGT